MSKDEPERMGKTRRELPEPMRGQPMPQPERPTIHYTELPEDTQGPIADEWNFYRREVGLPRPRDMYAPEFISVVHDLRDRIGIVRTAA